MFDDIINFEDFLDGDSTELDFNPVDFDWIGDTSREKDYILKPKMPKKPISVKYENAEKLVEKISLSKGEEIHTIVPGNFIFGEFLEALLVKKNATASECYLSTLSLSQENADSLGGLVEDGYIDNLTIIVSNYFYSHEKNRLIPYLIKETKEADIIIIRNHTKITLLTIGPYFIIISGSSNMRSSNCVEQLVIQESEELYAFYREWFEDQRKYSIRRADEFKNR